LMLKGAFGGLMVAIVVKYADAVVKGFATSASIILLSIASLTLFPEQSKSLSSGFLLGSIIVVVSIFNYSDDTNASAPSAPSSASASTHTPPAAAGPSAVVIPATAPALPLSPLSPSNEGGSSIAGSVPLSSLVSDRDRERDRDRDRSGNR